MTYLKVLMTLLLCFYSINLVKAERYTSINSIGVCRAYTSNDSAEEKLRVIACVKREYKITLALAKAIVKYVNDYNNKLKEVIIWDSHCKVTELKYAKTKKLGYHLSNKLINDYDFCNRRLPILMQELPEISKYAKQLMKDSKILKKNHKDLQMLFNPAKKDYGIK